MKKITAFAACLLLVLAVGCNEFTLLQDSPNTQSSLREDSPSREDSPGRDTGGPQSDPRRVTIPVNGQGNGPATTPQSSPATSSHIEEAVGEAPAQSQLPAPDEATEMDEDIARQAILDRMAIDETLLAVVGMTNGELKQHNGTNCLAEIGQGGSISLRYIDYYSVDATYPYNFTMLGDEAAMWDAVEAAGVTDLTFVGNVLPNDFIVLGISMAPDELFGNIGERWVYEELCEYFGQWPGLTDVQNHEGDWYYVAEYTYSMGAREYSLMFSLYENQIGAMAFGVYITDYSL